jgi:NADPH-dependent ferric siderophore reductase
MTTTGRVKEPGRLEGALARIFMKSATVSECRTLDERFRLVTLTGDALRGVRWTPGQKVQVAMGGWAYRTFTPLSWDAARGTTQLLVFLHGDAPGAAWGRALKEGDPCTLFGPRDSLDLTALDRPALLFGDETSLGLAHALRYTPSGADGVRLVFEVDSRSVVADVLKHLGIASADLIERRPQEAHLDEVVEVAVGHLRAHGIKSFALSGKAPSIQALNKRLRALGLGGRQIRTRAYWAPGKVGLD